MRGGDSSEGSFPHLYAFGPPHIHQCYSNHILFVLFVIVWPYLIRVWNNVSVMFLAQTIIFLQHSKTVKYQKLASEHLVRSVILFFIFWSGSYINFYIPSRDAIWDGIKKHFQVWCNYWWDDINCQCFTKRLKVTKENQSLRLGEVHNG